LGRGIEVAVEAMWMDWSTIDEMRIEVEGAPLGIEEYVVPRDWHDSSALRLGLAWHGPNGWRLRLGYAYDATPIPDETMHLDVPDSDKHILAMGIGRALSQDWRIDVGIDHKLFDRRNVRRSRQMPPADGYYGVSWGAVVLGITGRL